MKKSANLKSIIIIVVFFLTLLLTARSVNAAGLLKSVNANNDAIQIKSHHVNVSINNGFARTEVDQIFENLSDQSLDAIYSFPLPKQASLSELSLWINGQEIIGEVLEKEKAKAIHNEQKKHGKSTALAEKVGFKSFDICVSPIKPNQDTRVRLVYYQPLEIDLGIGRYLYPLAEGGVDEERIAFWEVDNKVSSSFKFDLTLKSAFPVDDIRMPGYENVAAIQKLSSVVNSEKEGRASGDVYHVTLNSNEGATLDKDLVFYYRLNPNVPARVELIPFKANASTLGTFMAVITPGASLKRIAEGTDWTFVLDKSGSMSGAKINSLCDGVSSVIGKLGPNDRFRIITFNNSASDLTKGYVSATQANINKYIKITKKINASGGTALFSGLKMAYNKLDIDRTSGVILVSDGVCNVGPTEHKAFLNLIKQKDIRLFTFVMGNSANQPLMDRLAKDSGGFAMNISDADDIIGCLIQAKAKVLYENMHNVRIDFEGAKISDLTPHSFGNLYLGQQLVVFGHYDIQSDVKITLSAKISGVQKSWSCSTHFPAQDNENPEIERLWALSKIDELMQNIRENGALKANRKEIIRLGSEYSLVTDYTSMLVIDEPEMENQGIQRKNANRTRIERKAQAHRASKPVKSYQANRKPSNSMWKGIQAPSIGGSGPVGLIILVLASYLRKRKKNSKIVF